MPSNGQDLMRPVDWAAITILAREAKEHRDDLTPGQGQEVDRWLHVQGHLSVGEDGRTHPTIKPSVEELLAVVFETVTNGQRTKLFNLLVERYTDLPDGQRPEVDEVVRTKAETCISAISRTEDNPRRGAVTGSLEVSVIHRALPADTERRMERASRQIILQ